MEIILKKDVEKLGTAGQVLSVKDGYARNFLFPKGWALPATGANLKVVERERVRTEQRLEKAKQMGGYL